MAGVLAQLGRTRPGLVASAGELRALYLAVHDQSTMVAQRQPMPSPGCFWVLQEDTSSASLRVAWPGSQLDEHEVATVDVLPARGR